MNGLNSSEYEELKQWFLENREKFPPEISNIFLRLLTVYWDVLEKKKGSLETLKQLRQLMGFIPKSERGSQEKHDIAI